MGEPRVSDEELREWAAEIKAPSTSMVRWKPAEDAVLDLIDAREYIARLEAVRDAAEVYAPFEHRAQFLSSFNALRDALDAVSAPREESG